MRWSLLITVIILLGPGQSLARMSNPNKIVEDSTITSESQIPESKKSSTWDKVEQKAKQVKNKVQSWWSDKVNSVWGEKEKVANDDPVKKRTQKLPEYQEKNKGSSPEDIQKTAQDVENQKYIEVKEKGQKGSSRLKENKDGVPQFPFVEKKQVQTKDGGKRVVRQVKKDLPRLDIGREPKVKAKDFSLPGFQFMLTKEKRAKPLDTPSMMAEQKIKKWTGMKIKTAQDPKKLPEVHREIGHPVTARAIEKIQPELAALKKIHEHPVRILSKDQKTLLTALVFYQKENRCPGVMGLLAKLRSKDKFEDQANYYIGSCAQKLDLYSEAFASLSQIAVDSESKFQSRALGRLFEDLPKEYQSQAGAMIRKIQDVKVVPEPQRDQAIYLAAKEAFRKEKYSEVREYASSVQKSSRYYGDARYLIGVSYYGQGRRKQGVAVLRELWKWMQNGGGNSNLKALTAMNLARTHFSREEYAEAVELYKKVGKNHPLWLDALVEQGWAQLMMQDNAGAIGNMYSLHSPYFKSVYKPESYVVRTIGYLNMCQYGDAYRTLTWLEKRYKPWLKKVKKYTNQYDKPNRYYQTVKSYLQGKSTKDVDGLPFQVIREIARKKDYLNIQEALNQKIEEDERYGAVMERLDRAQKAVKWRLNKAKKRKRKLQARLHKAKTDKSLAKHISQWKAQLRQENEYIVGYNYELKRLRQSSRFYQKLRRQIARRMNKEKRQLRSRASKALVRHLFESKKEMKKVLENNEFLRYEVFAGAGENLRYQMAGGSTKEKKRIPAHIKPQKIMNWQFSGEFWEDEIGNYRSSLSNNCPSAGKMRSGQRNKNASNE